jgi:hypothetical protein
MSSEAVQWFEWHTKPVLRAGYQPRKGGDMVCVRGPLGTCVATCHNVGDREGPLRVFEVVPFLLY